MKKNRLIFVTILMAAVVVLESILFKKFPQHFIYPDIALVILVFFSNSKGYFEGEISGFIVGAVEDFLSLSPPGFNSIMKTIIGFIFGKLKGKIFIDPIFFPLIMIFIATLMKGIIAVTISTIFFKPEAQPVVFTSRFLIEIIENCISAPFIFALMKLTKLYTVEDRSF